MRCLAFAVFIRIDNAICPPIEKYKYNLLCLIDVVENYLINTVLQWYFPQSSVDLNCAIFFPTMQFSLCECYCRTVCIGSKYLQKNREKSLQNRAKRDFCKFFEIFLQILRSYTHSAAIAWTLTKLHSSREKMHSENQHLIADGIFCHFSPCLKSTLDLNRPFCILAIMAASRNG